MASALEPSGGGVHPSAAVREIRATPERFVGSLGDGTALHNLAFELVALSVMESFSEK